jgi:predicted ATPase/DNA-binding CsgD family transcriptional regulator
MNGFPATLTSFVGRAQQVDDVVGELGQYRLVTLTGPGGAGKTRLATEVARRMADGFANGTWLAELAGVRDPAQVPAAVAVALGIQDLPSAGAADALAHALAGRQLLLVLDNCEQVIGAAAELCGRLLLGADDVRVLATSREPLRIAGEARYRLGPLGLPDAAGPPGPGTPAGWACEAVTLFADRARLVEPGFTLDGTTGPLTARLVTRLDGIPLAIELAAARVDVLGVAQLLDRIDDRFRLLANADRLAQERQRSLAAAVSWSYELLDDAERRVFRAVSVFPGPFTLEGAEAVAGAGTGEAVLRLVECSLLLPPRTGPDDRSRYLMLETLRAFGAGLLAEGGELDDVTARFAAYAAELAEEAGRGLHTRSREAASLRQLDAEDTTMRHALAWSADHDPALALRLALNLAPWWNIRGHLSSQVPLLEALAVQTQVGSDDWCTAYLQLGAATMQATDPAATLAHYNAIRDVLCDADRSASPATPVFLSLCLGARSAALRHLGRVDEAADDSRQAFELAREVGSAGLEALAMAGLSSVARERGDLDEALQLARAALRLPDEVAGGLLRALSGMVAGVLIEAGDLAGAEQACAQALASSRQAGDLMNLGGQLCHQAMLDAHARRTGDAAAHLTEQLQLSARTGQRVLLLAGLDCCGLVCAMTGRPAEALTTWAATSALSGPWSQRHWSLGSITRDRLAVEARKLLGTTGSREAEQRGAAMSLAAATEYALLLAADTGLPTTSTPAASTPATDPRLTKLSPRERELVTLVAQGRTDAQIAAELYITMRTVSSHLDRIRDKTGCRRRAELTRLALSAGLV